MQCSTVQYHMIQSSIIQYQKMQCNSIQYQFRGVYFYFCGKFASHNFFFCHAEIFKSGYFMQIYSNQCVLCRNIGQVPLRVTQSCAADYLDRTKPNQTMIDALFILIQVPLINKNGTKSMHCIIRGKFVISPCRKSASFWIHAVILLFHAEILPCGPPLLPHSFTFTFDIKERP